MRESGFGTAKMTLEQVKEKLVDFEWASLDLDF
jgi:hypothetical protein